MCVETTSICIETTGIETTVNLKDAFKDTTVLNLGSRDGCNKWQNRTCSSGVSRDMNRDAVKSDLGKTFFIQVTVRDRFYRPDFSECLNSSSVFVSLGVLRV